MGIGRIAAVVAALCCVWTATAAADTVGAPAVYVRLVDPNNQTVPRSDWQPLPARLTTLGPYEIGVAVQPTSDVHNRHAIEVDLVSRPSTVTPSAWGGEPYLPYCSLVTGDAGAVVPTGALLYYQGNGTYAINVSAYTTAQWNARPGNTCSGGPTTPVSFTVNAATTASIIGAPLAPRTTAKAHGFAGFQFTDPVGNVGSRWRCARNPVITADGSVTGSPVTSGQDDGVDPAVLQIAETDAFTVPGRWACSAQGLGGDDIMDTAGTPWATTAPVTVKGQYIRDPERTSLRNLPHGRLRMTVTAIRQIAAATAGGQLTLTIFRAGCAHRTRVVLHRVLRIRSRVDRQGRAVFTFRAPTRSAFYAGRPTFGGGPLMLAGDDPSDMPLQALTGTNGHPIFIFVSPQAWSPCP